MLEITADQLAEILRPYDQRLKLLEIDSHPPIDLTPAMDALLDERGYTATIARHAPAEAVLVELMADAIFRDAYSPDYLDPGDISRDHCRASAKAAFAVVRPLLRGFTDRG